MNILLSYILNLLLNFLEAFAVYQLGSSFFSCKYRGWRRWLSFLLLFAGHVAVLVFLPGMFFVKIVAFVVIDTLWLWLVFKAQIIKCLLVSVLFSSIMIVFDSIILSGVSSLFLRDAKGYMQDPFSYYAFCYAAKMIELLLIVILKLILRKQAHFQTASWRDWLRVIMFPLLSTVISAALLEVYAVAPEAAPHILSSCVLLAVFDILAITLLNYLDRQQQALQDRSFLQHSMRVAQDNVNAWMNAYADQRKQTHEFQNQLAVINSLAQRDDTKEELKSYVDQLIQADTSKALFVSTRRSVVDAILNQKNAIAQGKGITLQVNLDDLSEFALPDDALVVVLSNLIDNAIAECEKIHDPDRRVIRLRMCADPDVSFLYIENPTAGPVKIVDNSVATTKGDSYNHGYGLKNIAAILNRYNAEYALDYQEEKQCFCFSAQIIPEKNADKNE